MDDWGPLLLGTVAGICSTTSFVPQVLKAWREGAETVSKRMYAITVTAFVLWLAYGFMIGSTPLLVFNTISLALSATILGLKIRDQRRARGT